MNAKPNENAYKIYSREPVKLDTSSTLVLHHSRESLMNYTRCRFLPANTQSLIRDTKCKQIKPND